MDWPMIALCGFVIVYGIMEYFNNGGHPPRFGG